jgi:hypothetical protein
MQSTFTMQFPVGIMRRTNAIPDLTDWTAVGVVSDTVELSLPTGYTVCKFSPAFGIWIPIDGVKLTCVIPDTYAHVHPVMGTGHVDAFQAAFRIELP